MATHPAVFTVAKGAPLEVHQIPTVSPTGHQVRVRNEWTASTPLDLHQNDGGLLVTPPQKLGDGVAGTVVEAGPDAGFKVGDKVFGFTWRNSQEKAYQLYVTAPDYLLGKIPEEFTMQQAVTLPNNFVTAWQLMINDLGLELPWPKPEEYASPEKDDWILIWGGSSSCGQYALQILKYYGYKNIITTSSKAHHAKLKQYGASHCIDYREGDVTDAILSTVSRKSASGVPAIKYIIDCIGSQSGSVQPVAKIAQAGSKVAILLPVIVRDADDGIEPIYEMDVTKCADWASGVEALGVRTHFYLQNEFLKEKLQSEIMPKALAEGIIEPNDQIIVEGKTLLERAEKAMGMLRKKQVSGGRLVWKVAEEENIDGLFVRIVHPTSLAHLLYVGGSGFWVGLHWISGHPQGYIMIRYVSRFQTIQTILSAFHRNWHTRLFEKVESDMGKKKNVSDTERIAAIAGMSGGGW